MHLTSSIKTKSKWITLKFLYLHRQQFDEINQLRFNGKPRLLNETWGKLLLFSSVTFALEKIIYENISEWVGKSWGCSSSDDMFYWIERFSLFFFMFEFFHPQLQMNYSRSIWHSVKLDLKNVWIINWPYLPKWLDNELFFLKVETAYCSFIYFLFL